MTTKHTTIGLFGFGCVGSGLYEVFQQNPTLQAQIKKIGVKHPDKKRSLPASYFTYNKKEILEDKDINVIVELIDDADEAFIIVSEALQRGKHVVTANKKMLANHFQTLIDLAKKNNVSLLYEAAVGGSIPIIRTLEEYYNNDTLTQLDGILNGTTNYILTKTLNEQKSYDEVLREAQALGFAESNPNMDVQAFDPKFKLVILLAHAFGVIVKPEQLFNYGIEQLSQYDIHFAKQRDYAIKLVASAAIVNHKIQAFVLPKFVPQNDSFYAVNNEFNAVQVSAAFSDKQLLTGKGAGSFPTAAAVLSDISALRYNYSYEYHKLNKHLKPEIDNNAFIHVYLRYVSNDVFEELQFETVNEEYRSKGYNYIIGSISLQQLIDADLLKRPDVFVAAIEEVRHQIKKTTINSTIKLAESIH